MSAITAEQMNIGKDDDDAFTFSSVRSLLFLILFLVFLALITEIEVISNFKHMLPYNPTSTPTKFYAASLAPQVQNNKLFAIPNH